MESHPRRDSLVLSHNTGTRDDDYSCSGSSSAGGFLQRILNFILCTYIAVAYYYLVSKWLYQHKTKSVYRQYVVRMTFRAVSCPAPVSTLNSMIVAGSSGYSLNCRLDFSHETQKYLFFRRDATIATMMRRIKRECGDSDAQGSHSMLLGI
jgi:hypothetical protein